MLCCVGQLQQWLSERFKADSVQWQILRFSGRRSCCIHVRSLSFRISPRQFHCNILIVTTLCACVYVGIRVWLIFYLQFRVWVSYWGGEHAQQEKKTKKWRNVGWVNQPLFLFKGWNPEVLASLLRRTVKEVNIRGFNRPLLKPGLLLLK